MMKVTFLLGQVAQDNNTLTCALKYSAGYSNNTGKYRICADQIGVCLRGIAQHNGLGVVLSLLSYYTTLSYDERDFLTRSSRTLTCALKYSAGN